jgi:hypothetical protein
LGWDSNGGGGGGERVEGVLVFVGGRKASGGGGIVRGDGRRCSREAFEEESPLAFSSRIKGTPLSSLWKVPYGSGAVSKLVLAGLRRG